MSNSWFKSRKQCPACNSIDLKTIYENRYNEFPIKDYLTNFYADQGMVEFEYLEGVSYLLCECGKCGLIFQKEIPGDFLMERLYEHWINPSKVFLQHYDEDNLEYYSNYAQEIMRMISYFNAIPSSLDFFDFGMGWGKWALMAKAFGCNSYGTELSAERIEYAKSCGINIVKGTEIHEHQFDLINTEQVFEHIPDPLNTLIYLKGALKPDGIIKISVPTANNISKLLKKMDWKAEKGSKNSLNPIAPLEHINFYRYSSILKMADMAGMEEVFIPIQKYQKYTINWIGPKAIVKNILRPIYRRVFRNQNYILLRNKTQNLGNI